MPAIIKTIQTHAIIKTIQMPAVIKTIQTPGILALTPSAPGGVQRWCQQHSGVSILSHGCQQYGEVYHYFMVNSTPRMSTIWWYNLPSHRLSTVQCCLPSLCGSTLPYGCQQDSDIYHDMDVNNTVMFIMTWMSKVLWHLPHGCQHYCDAYNDLVS